MIFAHVDSQIRRWRMSMALIGCMVLAACGGERWSDQDGNAYSAADLEGRWLVVNYWAEWCAPCRDELPELNALNKVAENIQVVGIHFDAYEGAELLELSERMDIRFPVLGHDFAAAYALPLPQVLPTTYIINPAGELAHTLQGPQDEAGLLALIQ
ncbi:TlpA family protein disulfide reductase [Halopseudomonas laoshanensis]|jgi:thiol-disulfide isomerase/thioredoxin|uniref:TlpA family protein disulfide reductase n=1 Tax=Halopseudomonas TaxID=2901189 RepID=UPI003735075E